MNNGKLHTWGKIFISIFSITLCVQNLVSQDQPESHHELFITYPNPGNNEVRIMVDAIGTEWDASYNIHSFELNTLISDESSVSKKFHHCNSPGSDADTIGFGKYRIRVYAEDALIFTAYADFRDCLYSAGYVNGELVPKSGDISFEYYSGQWHEVALYSDIDGKVIQNSEVVNIWDNDNNRNGTSPDHSTFQPYPPSNLQIANNQGNPQISWSSSSGPFLTGYKIYRSINSQGGNPTTYYYLASVSDQERVTFKVCVNNMSV